jgi:G3E family GTPase
LTGDEENHSCEKSGEEHHEHAHDHEHALDEDGEAPVHLTLREGRLESIGSLVLFLEDILHGEFGSVVRAKGTLRAGGEWVRFDVADGLYAVTGTEDENPTTQCVFIGRGLKRDALCGRLLNGEIEIS